MERRNRGFSKIDSIRPEDEVGGEDSRTSIDNPVPGHGQFVNRVEHAVTLQLFGASLRHPPLTIPTFFFNACQRYKKRIAFVSHTSTMHLTTYGRYYDRALQVARGLIAAGLRPMEGVAFMCHNSTSMFTAIMGTILAGGIYVDLCAPENRNWIIHTMSEAKVSFVFVDTIYTKDIQLDVWDELVHMRSIVMIKHKSDQDHRVMTLDHLVGQGAKVSDHVLARRLGMHAPNKCCAIFYRSNEILNQISTPGIMMSHDNLTITAILISEKLLRGHLGNFPDIHTKVLKLISILPLTKPTAFVWELLLPMAIGGCVHMSNTKLSTASLWRLVMAVEPNILCAPTRVWIHVRNKVMDKIRHLTKPRGLIFKRAKQTMLDSLLGGSPLPRSSSMVIQAVNKQLGLNDIGLLFCFGESLPQSHFEFFLSLNLQIFALREVRYLSGPHTIYICTDDYRTESMGTVFPEFSTKMIGLGKTAASSMFVKGRHVCMGILHESIAYRVDGEGYLNTDFLIANIQDDLFFVGSTGDEVVLRNGAVLSSEYVESSFKGLVPIVASCLLVGENMKTAALLITLKTVINPESLQATDVLTEEVQVWCLQKLQISYTSAEMLASSKNLHVVISAALTVINRRTKRSGGWIEAYKVLPRNFSVIDLEIDPITQELNRNLILQRYRDALEVLYPNEWL